MHLEYFCDVLLHAAYVRHTSRNIQSESGMGYVCNTYLGANPYPIDIVRMFNFSDEICKRIVQSPLTELSARENEISLLHDQPEESCNTVSLSNEKLTSPPPNSGNMDELMATPENNNSDISETAASPVSKACKAAKAGEKKAPKEAIKSWRETGFSSLIMAVPDMVAWTIVKEVLPLLSYSAPFAIYHQYLQPLATCMHNLQLGKLAIGLQIAEPWLREYQVLPSRTHPHMQMSAFGGYILTGTRICSA